jgi:hypothetical protein
MYFLESSLLIRSYLEMHCIIKATIKVVKCLEMSTEYYTKHRKRRKESLFGVIQLKVTYIEKRATLHNILYVPLILQQIQISVDQPYAGPGCQLLHYQRDI